MKWTYFTQVYLLHYFDYYRLLDDVGHLWTWWKDQVKYFVSSRLAAASGRSGTASKCPCAFLRSFRGPACYAWSQAKACCKRSRQTNGQGTPHETVCLEMPWFCNLSFCRHVAIPVCFCVFLRFGKIQNSSCFIWSLSLPSISTVYISSKHREHICFYVEAILVSWYTPCYRTAPPGHYAIERTGNFFSFSLNWPFFSLLLLPRSCKHLIS